MGCLHEASIWEDDLGFYVYLHFFSEIVTSPNVVLGLSCVRDTIGMVGVGWVPTTFITLISNLI